jgi:hypothetical protein
MDAEAMNEFFSGWQRRYSSESRTLGRMELLTQLVRFDGARAVELLRNAMTDDRDQNVRAQAKVLLEFLNAQPRSD